MIAAKVTCTSANTGYTLLELIQAVYGTGTNIVQPRASSITIQYLGSDDGYIVPNAGPYAETGHVPDQFGYSFANSGTYWEKVSDHNQFALQEIILGAQTDGDTFAVTVYYT